MNNYKGFLILSFGWVACGAPAASIDVTNTDNDTPTLEKNVNDKPETNAAKNPGPENGPAAASPGGLESAPACNGTFTPKCRLIACKWSEPVSSKEGTGASISKTCTWEYQELYVSANLETDPDYCKNNDGKYSDPVIFSNNTLPREWITNGTCPAESP